MPATWPPRAVIRKSAGLRTLESALYRGGLGPVAGVDEVGRGACAGPLVVAACVLGPNRLESLAALDDSKKLNERERERLFPADPALRAGLPRGVHPVEGGRSARRARRQHRGHAAGRRRAAAATRVRAHRRIPGAGAADAVAAGDRRRRGGRVYRGGERAGEGQPRPAHGRDGARTTPATASPMHKGYSTAAHTAALAELGPCAEHRYSFINVRRIAVEPFDPDGVRGWVRRRVGVPGQRRMG